MCPRLPNLTITKWRGDELEYTVRNSDPDKPFASILAPACTITYGLNTYQVNYGYISIGDLELFRALTKHTLVLGANISGSSPYVLRSSVTVGAKFSDIVPRYVKRINFFSSIPVTDPMYQEQMKLFLKKNKYFAGQLEMLTGYLTLTQAVKLIEQHPELRVVGVIDLATKAQLRERYPKLGILSSEGESPSYSSLLDCLRCLKEYLNSDDDQPNRLLIGDGKRPPKWIINKNPPVVDSDHGYVYFAPGSDNAYQHVRTQQRIRSETNPHKRWEHQRRGVVQKHVRAYR